ncbi:MAG: hypothetical protein KUG52_03310 [Immundisolibacteraceae bacterium]|nr:hypothetical protein [Immundisolibacteraceae bacterium]
MNSFMLSMIRAISQPIQRINHPMGSRTIHSTRFAALILIAGLQPLNAAQADIDRLFFTPQERQRLNHIRQGGGIEFQPTASQGQNAINTITVNGTLQKRGGGFRAWLNQKALDDADFNLPANVGRQLTTEGGLPLQLPGGLAATPRVGQQVNIKSGVISEAYLHPDSPAVIESVSPEGESGPSDDEPL